MWLSRHRLSQFRGLHTRGLQWHSLILTGLLYAVVSAAYLLAVPVVNLPSTPLVAARVVESAVGNWGGLLMAGLIACSAFGAANGYILTGARILYALGQDHPLFARLGMLHPVRRTPALALWTNAAVVIVLVCTKTFDQIATYSTVAITVFYVLAVAGVVVLRVRAPALPRPYRAWGYPWTAGLFCLTMIGFIANLWVEAPKDTAFGFGWMALGIPLYWCSQHLPRGLRIQPAPQRVNDDQHGAAHHEGREDRVEIAHE